MIDKSAYILRISQASPTGLVVISFELILEFLNESMQGDFRENIQKAKEGIEQLIQSLDFSVPLSHDFYDIYNYCYKLLCDVHFSSDKETACNTVKEVIELMEMLLIGWRDCAEKADTAETAEGGVPKVYTGLTYGKDGLANEYIDEDKDRGYMA
jgi:flagellin-specific chaperone FliS